MEKNAIQNVGVKILILSLKFNIYSIDKDSTFVHFHAFFR
jgi:hypothetical protein